MRVLSFEFGVRSFPPLFVIRHLPFVICHLSFAICHLSFAICHLPFVICHLPFVICHLSFAIPCLFQYLDCHFFGHGHDGKAIAWAHEPQFIGGEGLAQGV